MSQDVAVVPVKGEPGTFEVTHEYWCPVYGWEKYEASNWGRVRRADTQAIQATHRHTSRSEKIYLRVNLGLYGKKKMMVHVAVALAFYGPQPAPHETEGKYQVCHLDDDGLNNLVGNLKWGTNLSNQHAKKMYQEAHAVPLLEHAELKEAVG